MTELTEKVRLASGHEGEVWGILHSAPVRRLDIRLPHGGMMRNVPETDVVAFIGPRRTNLVRLQPVATRPQAAGQRS